MLLEHVYETLGTIWANRQFGKGGSWEIWYCWNVNQSLATNIVKMEIQKSSLKKCIQKRDLQNDNQGQLNEVRIAFVPLKPLLYFDKAVMQKKISI